MNEPVYVQWARGYINMGWKIIPINIISNGRCSCGKYPCGDTGEQGTPGYNPAGKNAGKHPVSTGWSDPRNACSRDEDLWRVWGRTVDPSRVQYSLGILCGEASGVWLLDVDPRNGGFESMDMLESLLPSGPLPQTLSATTGGGGKHFYFKMPPGTKIKKGPLHKDLPGIDVQADGAQTVLPPSLHWSGQRYEWDAPPTLDKIADTPPELLELLQGARSATDGGGSGFNLDAALATTISEGGRNNALNKFATSIARRTGTDSQEKINTILDFCVAYNSTRLVPPLDLDEVKKTVQSAIDFVTATPGGLDDLDPAQRAWVEQRMAARQSAPAEPVEPAAPRPMPVAPEDVETGETAGQVEAGGTTDGEPGAPGEGGGGGPEGGDGGDGGGDNPDGLPPDHDSLGDDGTPGLRTLTENGNARRIIDYFGENLRYTPGIGWYVWRDTSWQPDVEELGIKEMCRNIPVRIVGEIVNLQPGADPQPLITWADRSKGAGVIEKTVKMAKTDPRSHVPITRWDQDAHLLGVKNGVIDLRTGQLVPPSRDQYITKRTALNYEPRRRDTRWEIFLDQITEGDKDFQAWLQRAIGYTLTAETREQMFFIIYGPPGSGKSTVLSIIQALLGDYAIALQAENVMAQKYGNGKEEYYNAEIAGKRLIAVSELPEAEMMKEDSIKRLTGADTLTGRRVAQQPFTFTSQGKLWVATNHRPRIKDTGMWRRMRAVPFMYKPQILDKTLKPYLMDPEGGLPAAMAWAVEGAMRWYASRDGVGRCQIVDEATAEYQEAEDELGIFLREEMRASEGASVGMAEVYTAYRLWLEDRGIQNPGPINKLMRALVDRGLDVDGSGRRARVEGWSMIPRAVPEVAEGGGRWGQMLGTTARFS